VKRFSIGEKIDTEGWADIIRVLIKKHVGPNHHHEICWLIWVAFVCKLPVSDSLIYSLAKIQNSHVQSLLIAGYKGGFYKKKPEIKLGIKLNSTDDSWLSNLVGRTSGYSKASFSGAFASEFEHFVSKNVQLINFKKHIDIVSKDNYAAISSSKYGYDADDDEDEDQDLSWFSDLA
jgi:hypothetical protein